MDVCYGCGMPRLADPYRDLAVIDARAPRTNQIVVALLAATAVATGAWPLLGLLALQLAIAVRFGRRWCLPCRLYFDLIQPRFGEGPLEDSRAPRFANIVGAIFLAAATAAYGLGLPTVGAVLGLTVVALASLAATTGLCVGCELYKLVARVRGVRGGAIERVDLEGLGAAPADETVVVFTHPLCGDCQRVGAELAAAGKPIVSVDVSRRRDLARKYGVALVPLAVAVDARGFVTARLH